ncbi:MAG TPA: ABC transporter permease [Cryomorphaceae bacterium]|nr:ABC transporter permease [Cryomorphaceae bacterium]
MGRPDKEGDWDLIIEPASTGRARLTEVFRHWDLLLLFVRRDLVVQYKQTVLGPLWILLQPLLRVATFYIVFGRIAEVPTDGVPPILFYLVGLVFWEFFASVWKRTSDLFFANQQIFSKVYFPRMVMAWSVVLSAGVRLAVQIVLLVAVAVFYHFSGYSFHWQPTVLLIPVYVAVMAMLSVGLGLIFASITAKYRDLRFLIDVIIQLALFLSPIIYPLSLAQGLFRTLLLANPMTSLLEALRFGVLGKGAFLPSALLYSVGASVLVFLIGYGVFLRTERKVMDTI